jgi:hypothetical protein
MAKDARDAPKVVTANELHTGAVVFLDHEHRWTGDIHRAEIAADPDGERQLLAKARADHDASIVVEPALIAVEAADGRVMPLRLRERIRAGGPTVAVAALTRRPV